MDEDTQLAEVVRSHLERQGSATEEDLRRRAPFMDWTVQVPEPRGPLDFSRFAPLRELYGRRAAEDREQVFKKATQVGISTQQIRLALYHADVRGYNVLYAFPTQSELGDFSRHRIRPIVKGSAYLRSHMPLEAIDNVAMKQVGLGYVFFRGTEKPIESLPIDLAIFDELDSCNQAHIEASMRRVSGPDSAGLVRKVGVPILPGGGIASAYEKTDRRAWTVKCGCGHHNRLEGFEGWAACVDTERAAVVCAECRRLLDLTVGEWVAEFPDRDVRGYQLPKYALPAARLPELIANSVKTRPDEIEAFRRRDLGEEYASEESRLSEDQVAACVDPQARLDRYAPRRGGVRSMGVDVASARGLHVVAEDWLEDGRSVVVFAAHLEDEPGGRGAFAQAHEAAVGLRVDVLAVDRDPEGTMAEGLAARLPGVGWTVKHFDAERAAVRAPQPWIVDDRARHAALWRTRILDHVFDRFRRRAVILPPLEAMPPDYARHLGSLVRQTKESPNGDLRVVYVKAGGQDDFAHAHAYSLAARELWFREFSMRTVTHAPPVAMADELGFDRTQASSWEGDPEYSTGLD